MNKVLAANKRIAAINKKRQAARKLLNAPPMIKTLANKSIKPSSGFVKPSVYQGKNLYDTLNAFKDKTGMPASEYIMNKGLPPIGNAGGDKSLELINKIVDPKDKYIKINPGIDEAIKAEGFASNTKANQPARQKVVNFFSNIQNKADKIFGSAKDIAGDMAKQEDKLKYITKGIAENFPKIAIKGVDLIKKIGFAMLTGGPSMIGADLIPESVIEEMAQELGLIEGEKQVYAEGGMANINDMIIPLSNQRMRNN